MDFSDWLFTLICFCLLTYTGYLAFYLLTAIINVIFMFASS